MPPASAVSSPAAPPPPPSPTAPPSATPLATLTPTPIPIIIEQHTSLNITPLPTSALQSASPTPLVAQVQAAEPRPTPQTSAMPDSAGGFDLPGFVTGNWIWEILAVIALGVITLAVIFLKRRGQAIPSYDTSDTPSYAGDAGEGYGSAAGSVGGYAGASYDVGREDASGNGYSGYGQIAYSAGDNEDLPDYLTGVGAASSPPQRYDPNAPTIVAGYEPYGEGELN